jgi:hypothetical protein
LLSPIKALFSGIRKAASTDITPEEEVSVQGGNPAVFFLLLFSFDCGSQSW